MMTIQQEFQQDVTWFKSQVQAEVWSQVVFIDPLPSPQPIPTPFLGAEIIEIGEGFTLTRIDSMWELRRGRSKRGGIYIARFYQWPEAVGCASALKGNLDCWDLETVPDVIARYNGLGYEVKL